MTDVYVETPGYFSAVLDGLSGGYGPTGLTFDPIEIFFGTMIVGESDFTPRTITVTNTGPTPVSILGISITVGSAYFSLVSPGGYPGVVNPGQSFDVGVRASLTSTAGRVVGMIEIQTNEDRKTYIIGLSGRVISGTSWDSAISAITSDFQGRLDHEAYLRVTGDSAEAGSRTSMGVGLSDLIYAQIASEQSTRVSAIAAEATLRTNMGVQLTSDLVASINTEQTTRANQFAAEAISRTTLEANLRGTITSTVNSEASARTTAIAAVALDLYNLSVNFTTTNNTTNVRIDDEIYARASAASTEATRINNLFTALTQSGGTIDSRISAGITSEATARTNAVAAEATRVDGLLANYSTHGSTNSTVNAAITTEQGVRSAADIAQAHRIDTLESSIISGGGGGIDTFARGAIVTEANTRAYDDGALAVLITNLRTDLTTEVGDRTTAVSTEVTNRNSAISTAVGGEASARTILAGRVTSTEGRITGTEGRLSSAEGRLTGTEGRLSTAETDIISAGVDLLNAVDDLNTVITDTEAGIRDDMTIIVNSVSAESTARTTLSANMTTLISGTPDVLNINSNFVDWDNPSIAPRGWTPSSLTRVSRVAGKVNPYAMRVAGISTGDDYFWTDYTVSPALNNFGNEYVVLECDVTLVTGVLTNTYFFVQYYNADHATQSGGDYIQLSNDPTTNDTVVGAGVVGQTYRFRKLIRVPAGSYEFRLFGLTNGSFMGARYNRTLDWQRCAVRPASSAEIAAMRADALSTTNANNIITTNSRIDTEISNRVSAVGAEATRVDLLLANYSTSGAVNTAISAAVLSESIARTLAIGDAISAEASSRLAISTRLNNIGSAGVTVEAVASATSAHDGALASLNASYEIKVDVGGNVTGFGLRGSTTGAGSATLWNADLEMGTGKVVFDNGVVMKVQGTGFGSANQFITWFGPKVAYSAMTEANAISYEKTNGYAYYRGGMDTGTLRYGPALNNGTGLTDTILGPFGTNGDSKVVQVTYSHTEVFGRSTTGSFSGSPTLTVYLYRRYNGGAWSGILASITTPTIDIDRDDGLSGTAAYHPVGGEPVNITITYSGALSFTDTTGGIGLFEYKASVVAHSGYSLSGTSFGGGATSQTVTVTSIE